MHFIKRLLTYLLIFTQLNLNVHAQVQQPMAMGERNIASNQGSDPHGFLASRNPGQNKAQPSVTPGSATSTQDMQSTNIVYKKNEVPGDFSKKYNLTAKQREQIKDVPLVGQNPGNVAPHKKGGVKVDTELTGESIPNGVKEFYKDLPNGSKVYYRELGNSEYSKIEITSITNKGTILEKISFK